MDMVTASRAFRRSEEHTSELHSLRHPVCRFLLEKKILISEQGTVRVRTRLYAASPTIMGPAALLTRRNSRTSAMPTTFFFNDTATTEIYTLSLHDALPI